MDKVAGNGVFDANTGAELDSSSAKTLCTVAREFSQFLATFSPVRMDSNTAYPTHAHWSAIGTPDNSPWVAPEKCWKLIALKTGDRAGFAHDRAHDMFRRLGINDAAFCEGFADSIGIAFRHSLQRNSPHEQTWEIGNRNLKNPIKADFKRADWGLFKTANEIDYHKIGLLVGHAFFRTCRRSVEPSYERPLQVWHAAALDLGRAIQSGYFVSSEPSKSKFPENFLQKPVFLAEFLERVKRASPKEATIIAFALLTFDRAYALEGALGDDVADSWAEVGVTLK